jgi:hypothetical protein
VGLLLGLNGCKRSKCWNWWKGPALSWKRKIQLPWEIWVAKKQWCLTGHTEQVHILYDPKTNFYSKGLWTITISLLGFSWSKLHFLVCCGSVTVDWDLETLIKGTRKRIHFCQPTRHAHSATFSVNVVHVPIGTMDGVELIPSVLWLVRSLAGWWVHRVLKYKKNCHISIRFINTQSNN